YFKNEVLRLRTCEIDYVIEKLESEHAIRFFLLLEDAFGIKHSLHSRLFVSHHLAEKRRIRSLRCHLQRLVLEEVCDLLLKRFRGWDSNPLVWDVLCFVYSRKGLIRDALFVLLKMRALDILPSIMSYNSLLHSLRHTDMIWDLYRDILVAEIRPTEYTKSIILDGLCNQSQVREALSFMEKVEVEPCIVYFNTLMSAFCRMGYLAVSKSFFGTMFKSGLSPDAYSYNILINGLCDIGSLEEALGFSIDMEKHGLGPDEVTYDILAKGFYLFSMVHGLWKLPRKLLDRGPDLLTYVMLICGHCQVGNSREGLRLRDEMLMKGLRLNRVSYRVIIGSLCKTGQLGEALGLLSELKNSELQPDSYMYSVIIDGLCKLGDVENGIRLYREMCSEKILPNSFPRRPILSGLCQHRNIDEARSYLNIWISSSSGSEQDVVLYNILIDKHVKRGYTREAEALYRDMLDKGISPTAATFNTLIDGSLRCGRLADAREWMDRMRMHKLVPNVVTYTSFMNAFSEAGNLKSVFRLLEEMEANGVEANVVTYTVIIKALRRQGKLEESLRFLNDMLARGLSPDQVTYNSLIQSFCAARDFETAFWLHNEMIRLRVLPNHATYNILIDGLCVHGSVGLAERVFSFLRGHEVDLSKVAYTSLLKAICAKKGGDVRKAKALFREMVEVGFEISVKDYSGVINRLCRRCL
ncbi:hypothetical protein M569_10921, partial [Genlisea aurea]